MNDLYTFLGSLAQEFKNQGHEDIALAIVEPSFKFIASQIGPEPMNPDQLAKAIAEKYQAYKTQDEAIRAEIEALYP